MDCFPVGDAWHRVQFIVLLCSVSLCFRSTAVLWVQLLPCVVSRSITGFWVQEQKQVSAKCWPSYLQNVCFLSDHIRLLSKDMGSQQLFDQDHSRQLLCWPEVQQHVQLCCKLQILQ